MKSLQKKISYSKFSNICVKMGIQEKEYLKLFKMFDNKIDYLSFCHDLFSFGNDVMLVYKYRVLLSLNE